MKPVSEKTAMLVLFVAGDAPTSVQALTNLRRVLETTSDPSFEIVDVFASPETALSNRILMTPTLMRAESPWGPRLVGNLSDEEALRAFLHMENRGS